MRKFFRPRIGQLVGWSHKSAEGIGRVAVVNCATVTVAEVVIDDVEASTGDLRKVSIKNIWDVPTPAEIAERGAVEQELSLARKAREGMRRHSGPGIREYAATVFGF